MRNDRQRLLRSGEARAERLAENREHCDAAEAYLQLASTSATGSERDRLTLLAVDQWLMAGHRSRARRICKAFPVLRAAMR